MARIDCSVTVIFLKETKRMCESFDDCSDCPVKQAGHECDSLAVKFPEAAVEIVQKWSDEHPQKTRLDDLLEKYPKVYISSGNTPSIRPYMLGYCENCDDCVYSHCEASECWDEPVDGGATGKAVE